MALRIATVQAEAVPGEIEANLRKAGRFIAEGAAQGAELIVFPEAFVTGYDDAVFAGPLPTASDVAWLAPVQRAADTEGIAVVLNTAFDHGDHLALTDLVLAPHRPPIVAYDKQHLYAGERPVFTPGAGGFSFSLGNDRLALSVCYDANFPEHAAAAAADGATVYLNSGAYYPGGAHRRDLHYAARALDNGIYVVFSGLIGAPSDFIGGSAVFNPLGERIASVTGAEGIAVADIDPELIARTREQQRMWADRRTSLGDSRHHELR